MKFRIIILILTVSFISCKNNSSSEQKNEADKVVTADDKEPTQKQRDGLTLLKGDFLFLEDAAVLQTHREIYAVIIDEKMHELNDMVQVHKSEATDMVPVEIRGKITERPQGEEGWPFRVAIKEILNVSAPDPTQDDVIKISDQ